MKFLKFKAFILALAAFSFFLVSCSDDDSTTNTPVDNEAPAAPGNLMATSINDSTVALKWDKSTSDTSAKFVGYIVYVDGTKHDSVNATTLNVSKLSTEVHTFLVKAKFSNGQESVVGATIKWSTATRFVENINSEDIKIYETASSYGSGLNFFDEEGKAPKTVTVGSYSDWNLGLYTKNDKLIIGSPRSLDYSASDEGGVTEIANPVLVSSLDQAYDSQGMDSKTYSERTIDLSQYTNSFVLYVRVKKDGHYNYAKILVEKDSNGFLAGSGSDRYVKLQISYQKVVDRPYAK